jgi:hypothetical protein
MKLSNVERVNLGREHGVASWLLEGVAGLVERDPAMSADDLETELGLRTAFKIVSLQARFENTSPLSTVILGQQILPSFPPASLGCGSCSGQMVGPAGHNCHSCSRSIGLNDRGAIYLRDPNPLGSALVNRGKYWAVVSQQSKVCCRSCSHQIITRPFECQACHTSVPAGDSFFLLCGPGWPDIYAPSLAIREVFKDDITQCDM